MDWNKRFFFLFSLVTIFRLVYLFVAPLDLAADEAYYWDWSRQLDWGYFSKPPMVAWLIAVFCRTLGSATAVVRLPAVVLGAVSTLVIFLLARRMYDSRTAFWAAAAAMASPGASALSFIMTIDAPLLCFWSLALYMFWAGLERAYSWEWFGLAAAIGLGLLSKQVMGAFIVFMFVFAVVSRADRRLLKSGHLFLFSFAGIAALTPSILWNARHGWVTLHHTATHFMRSPAGFIAAFAEFIGGQSAIVSPVTWVLFVTVSAALFLHWRSKDRRVIYLLCFSFVPLLGVIALSLRQRIEPNWPAAVYPAGMILLSAWGCGNIAVASRMDLLLRPYFKKGVAIGAVMALLTYAFPFWAGAAPGPWAGRLIARMQGWRQLGVEAGKALGEAPRPEGTFILTFSRQLASELAFYAPGQPRVYNWPNPGGAPESQYDIWEGPKIGWDALIVVPRTDSRKAAAITGYFESVERFDSASLEGGGHSRYDLYLGSSLRKWPAGAADGDPGRRWSGSEESQATSEFSYL
ncbi:MAG TPA: glycosyltransferase family 39 protein [Syntrophobacteraceae bacterium]|nr:glycosyltransferase family 39 protein [Syntrophobacteraceae bacterium]